MADETDFYRDIQETILIPILNRMKENRGEIAELAKKLESENLMKHAKVRLAELRSGKRVLSFFFLKIMVDGGIMTTNQIKRGRKFEELNPIEKDVVMRLEADPETLLLIHDAAEEGIDVKQLLKISLKRV